jgi:hypothetical protein
MFYMTRFPAAPIERICFALPNPSVNLKVWQTATIFFLSFWIFTISLQSFNMWASGYST